jgi:hypothetical protein
MASFLSRHTHGQPVVDSSLGGTHDLYDVSGAQAGASTVIAFSRRLSGTGSTDVAIENKRMYLLLSAAPQDGWVSVGRG